MEGIIYFKYPVQSTFPGLYFSALSHNYSQKEMGDVINKKKDFISKVEKSKQAINIKHLDELTKLIQGLKFILKFF